MSSTTTTTTATTTGRAGDSESIRNVTPPPAPAVEWLQTVELSYEYSELPPPPSPICFGCGTSPANNAKLLKCARCHVASYCQKDCQVRDWKKREGGHKLACASYKRVGPHMRIEGDADRKLSAEEILGRVRFYVFSYGVHKQSELGRGFLFLQSDHSLATTSLTNPVDVYGRSLQQRPRSILIHFLTLGEYDTEVCRDDFEMALVRTELTKAVESYDETKQIIVLMKFRCGYMVLGRASLVPDYGVCRKLGRDYFAQSTAASLQLNLDDL